jgi:hypothetical protein
MPLLVNSLNIGAVTSQADCGSSLQICGYEFESWSVHGNYSIYSVCLYVIDMHFRLSIYVNFKDFSMLEDF